MHPHIRALSSSWRSSHRGLLSSFCPPHGITQLTLLLLNKQHAARLHGKQMKRQSFEP